ncbi:family 20 glycosylhydrolase [Enterococcus hirae]|uniref:family 20 glycosylhydrolase n=1 Tax=Enterococcus hirae TaxID=1354 RepID=UPI00391BACD1
MNESNKPISVTKAPSLKERGVILDIGRKFYSIDFLKELVDYMASLKMNALQLHFSDNEGFRLECETIPEITSEKFLTKQEMTDLIDYAEQKGISVIPEFDSPGHLQRLLAIYPQWQMERKGEDSLIFPTNRALDITKKDAVAMIKKMIKEYAELFHRSDYFHLGADEYIEFSELDKYPALKAQAIAEYHDPTRQYDVFIDYINELADYVETLGKKARIWNDGVYKKGLLMKSKLKPSIQITYWTKHQATMSTAGEFLTRDHQLINVNDQFFYFVLGEGASYKYPTAQKIQDNWTIDQFPENQRLTNEQMKKVQGAYFAIWSDYPDALTEEEVLTMIKEPLAAQQQIIWHETI